MRCSYTGEYEGYWTFAKRWGPAVSLADEARMLATQQVDALIAQQEHRPETAH